MAAQPLVIEFGTCYVRAGRAGESAPRLVLASPLAVLREPGQPGLLGPDAWRGAVDVFAAELVSLRLLARPAQHCVLLVEDPCLPRAAREALVDAVVGCGPKGVAFCPGLAAAAVAASHGVLKILGEALSAT